jgi:hypothetical protein
MLQLNFVICHRTSLASMMYCLAMQVLDVASGKALLDPPISSCAGDLTWWGHNSSTLLYTAEVSFTLSASSSSSSALLHAATAVLFHCHCLIIEPTWFGQEWHACQKGVACETLIETAAALLSLLPRCCCRILLRQTEADC